MVLNVSCQLIRSISLNILAFISFFLFSGLRYALGNNVFKFQVYTSDNWLTKTLIKLKSHTSVNQTNIMKSIPLQLPFKFSNFDEILNMRLIYGLFYAY